MDTNTPFQTETHLNKNLNFLFNKPEQMNFSSIILNSDRESIVSNSNLPIHIEDPNRTPEMYNNLNTLNTNSEMKKLTFSNQIYKKFYDQSNTSNIPKTNSFAMLSKKLKYDEILIKDIISYAGALFDLKEYLKCTYVLRLYAVPKYPTAMFLYYYSEYMIIQQKKQEELLENSDLGSKYYAAKEMSKLCRALQQYNQNSELSPFLLYLYGVVLKESKMINEAKTIFIKCLNQFPFLWSAWVEIALIAKQNEIKILFSEIEDHWMKYFYLANFLLEKNYEHEAITVANSLMSIFPNSIFLLNTIAHAYYQIHEYETSQEFFEKLLYTDPHRYENLDTLSNILFIKENYCDLSNLAFKCYQNDKYRPETCCVIGNYYGLKGDHAKAVVYFKRAVKLDYCFLPAWTLMGHEYMEMKSIPAAIESYRTAVDIDPTDYRAWYGLGQTYEIHQMYNYAVYYFLNSAKTKPNDSRMWTALGSCFEKLEKRNEAIKCYEKAVYYKDKEGIALYKMAKLYFYLGDEDKAAICFKENLRTNFNNSDEVDNAEIVESYFFLAKYHKKRGDYDEAYNYLLKLKNHEGLEKDEIHSMMREITNLRGNINRSHSKNRNNMTNDNIDNINN